MSKIAVVTGGNQGLGFALVEGLCKVLPKGSAVYLTARDACRGRDAVLELRQKGLEPIFSELDVADDASVQNFAVNIAREHGGVDIVISNAAARISKDVPQAIQVRNFINTNNNGTCRILRFLAPLLRNEGRLLVVASGFGSLTKLDPRLHHLFDVSRCSIEDIENVMEKYVDLVERGIAEANFWPDWINIPSKIAQVAVTKIFARDNREEFERRGILIDAVCPGLIDTAASRPWFADMSSAQTPTQAAADIVWLATLSPNAPGSPGFYGELVRHREIIAWL